MRLGILMCPGYKITLTLDIQVSPFLEPVWHLAPLSYAKFSSLLPPLLFLIFMSLSFLETALRFRWQLPSQGSHCSVHCPSPKCSFQPHSSFEGSQCCCWTLASHFSHYSSPFLVWCICHCWMFGPIYAWPPGVLEGWSAYLIMS